MVSSDLEKDEAQTAVTIPHSPHESKRPTSKRFSTHRIREIVWDSLDRTPEERRLIFKIDFFIL